MNSILFQFYYIGLLELLALYHFLFYIILDVVSVIYIVLLEILILYYFLFYVILRY